MKAEEYVVIPRTLLPELARRAYDLSEAKGMGFIHFTPGPLPEPHLQAILDKGNDRNPLSMDYVLGRAVKMTVFSHPTDETLALVPPHWYEHTHQDLIDLLTTIGVGDAAELIYQAKLARLNCEKEES